VVLLDRQVGFRREEIFEAYLQILSNAKAKEDVKTCLDELSVVIDSNRANDEFLDSLVFLEEAVIRLCNLGLLSEGDAEMWVARIARAPDASDLQRHDTFLYSSDL
jgi:hypothetical protein